MTVKPPPQLGKRIPTTVYFTDGFNRYDGDLDNGWQYTDGLWMIVSSRAVGNPGMGPNLLVDGGMENWNSPTDLTNWTEVVAGASTVNQEGVDIHGGTYCTRMDGDANNNSAEIRQSALAAIGDWLYFSHWGKGSGSPAAIWQVLTDSVTLQQLQGSTWANYFATRRILSNAYFYLKRASFANKSIYLDDAAVYKLTFVDMLCTRNANTQNPDHSVKLTIAADMQAGLITCLDDRNNPQNYILVYIDRNTAAGTKISMEKVVSGVRTSLIAPTAITYGVDKPLRIVKDGTNVSMYYDGVQVGATQTISNIEIINNTYHGFLTSSPNNSFEDYSITGAYVSTQDWPGVGDTVYVTNLGDSGPGSLRAALALTSPKTIKFNICGNIDLLSTLTLSQPGHIIDGSSAPYGGVCLRKYGIYVDTENITIRHIRIRPGSDNGNDIDAIGTSVNCDNLLVEYCSLSWSTDELFGSYGTNIIIRYCLLYEPLNNAGHPYGPIWSGLVSHNVDFHHNLVGLSTYRCPKVDNGADHYSRVANNVIYTSRWVTIDTPIIGETVYEQYIDIMSNYFIADPTWVATYEIETFDAQVQAHVYLNGNIGPHRPTLLIDELELIYPGDEAFFDLVGSPIQPAPDWLTDYLTAYADVLANAGATLPKRDVSDTRIINHVIALTGALITDPSEVGGWPDLTV